MTLYFWQNMVAMHQVHCLRALAERHEVHWMVDAELESDRRDQGWVRPDTGAIHVRTVKISEVAGILDAAPRDALHVFAPRGSATGPMLLRQLPTRGLRFAILAETPNGSGWRLGLRQLLYRLLAWRCRRAEFLLAMGEGGRDWYDACGFRNVFPFAYTVPDSVLPVVPQAEVGYYRFIIVARLIPLKQHVLLFRALAQVPGDWRLECIGTGPLAAQLHACAQSLGIGDKMTWVDAMPNEKARERMAQSDTLVLCSEWEGWGAVVSEAIAEGTRVVVSDVCGASCLMSLGEVGDVFPAGDEAALVNRLRRQVARGTVTSGERSARRRLYSKVNGAAMAAYMDDIIGGRKPPAPWLVR